MTAPYGRRLADLLDQRGRLCVGIDPHPAILDRWELPASPVGIERCARGMVEALGEIVAVFKPQSAFFEAYGSPGIAVLERTLVDIAAAGALSILDVKRGDIGSTMEAYADAYLDPSSPLAADAITASPYLGFGSLAPAIELASAQDRGVYVLALTSNPEARQLQQARVADGRSVVQVIVDEAAQTNRGDQPGPVGLVVGATVGRTGVDFTALNGSILAPGLGTQGGTAGDLPEVFGAAVPMVLPSLSREVMAAGPDPVALRTAASRIVGEMEAVLGVG